MRAYLSILSIFFVTGCVTTGNVPTDIAGAIPSDARAIRLSSDETPLEYYRTISRAFAERGFPVIFADEGTGTITTGFKDIGEQTVLQITAVIAEYEEGGTYAMLRGQWSVTTTLTAGLSAGLGAVATGEAEEANWSKSGRPKRAFGELAVIADDIPHKSIEYLTS